MLIQWDSFFRPMRHTQYPLLTFCSTNDSVGWLHVDHHLLLLLQRPQQQQQQRHVLLQHPVLLQYTRVTLLEHPLSSKDDASTSSDILAAASQATAAAVLIPGSTSTHMKRRCNFRSEDVPCLGLLHEVAPAVPSAGRTRARTSCCLRRRDGKECRLCTHNVPRL